MVFFGTLGRGRERLGKLTGAWQNGHFTVSNCMLSEI